MGPLLWQGVTQADVGVALTGAGTGASACKVLSLTHPNQVGMGLGPCSGRAA